MGGSPTLELDDPNAAVAAILAAPGLRARLALALWYLEQRWPSYTDDFRRIGGDAQRLRETFRASGEAFTIDRIDEKTLRWLTERRADTSDDLILAYLGVVDSLLEPFAQTSLADYLEGEHEIPGRGTIHIWIAPAGLLRSFALEAQQAVSQDKTYGPTISDHMQCIRHAASVKGVRTFEVESLHPVIRQRVEQLRARVARDGLRIGLFSLRGPFAPPLVFTRQQPGFGGGSWYRFRADAVVSPTDAAASLIWRHLCKFEIM